MIGQLGENSIAAVGLGGNFMLIFSVVIGAIEVVAELMEFDHYIYTKNAD